METSCSKAFFEIPIYGFDMVLHFRILSSCNLCGSCSKQKEETASKQNSAFFCCCEPQTSFTTVITLKVQINRDHISKGETMETALICLDLDVVGYLGSSRHSSTVDLRMPRNRTHLVKLEHTKHSNYYNFLLSSKNGET